MRITTLQTINLFAGALVACKAVSVPSGIFDMIFCTMHSPGYCDCPKHCRYTAEAGNYCGTGDRLLFPSSAAPDNGVFILRPDTRDMHLRGSCIPAQFGRSITEGLIDLHLLRDLRTPHSAL